MSYPSIKVENPGDELVVLLEGIPEGDLPVIISHNNKAVKLKSIKKTPKVISVLLLLYSITLVISEDKYFTVKSVEELLEVGDFDWTD